MLMKRNNSCPSIGSIKVKREDKINKWGFGETKVNGTELNETGQV